MSAQGGGACDRCGRGMVRAYTLRDWRDELGESLCLHCALEALAAVQGDRDAGALKVCPIDCERWRWLAENVSRRDAERPSWAQDDARWQAAVAAVRPLWDDFRHPWAVVANVYDATGSLSQ